MFDGILEEIAEKGYRRMRVVGIIAEYNPLHNGHIYHLEQALKESGAAYSIVALSGNFVQRGEPACTDKLTRTEWALKAGADLVIELPSIYAVSNAERFALGGVRTLAATGVVTDLAFGCEETDLRTLTQLVDIIVSEPPLFTRLLHENLKLGKSYPRARFDALKAFGIPEDMLSAIAKPNNILAIEYLRTLKGSDTGINPLPITRTDAGYNSLELTGEYSSATAIRRALSLGDSSALAAMPSFVGGPMLYDQQFPITQEMLEDLILYALRRLSIEALRELPDIGEGLENVIYRAVRSVNNLADFYEAVKSKRYTLARCKRIAVCALLGITSPHIHDTLVSPDGLYLRVLGFNKNARPLLSMIGKNAAAPLILRNSDIANCPPIVQKNLAIDALSTDILNLALHADFRRDYTAPVIF